MAKTVRPRRWMMVAALLAVLFLPGFLQVRQLKARQQELQKELGQLRRETLRLKQEERLLQEDPLYLERVARRKLGVAREGEVIYHFTDEIPSR